MGGYGSTRWGWHTAKRTTDECLALDLRTFYRRGLIGPNMVLRNGEYSWIRRDSRSTISVSMVTRADSGEAWLSYRYNRERDMSYVVRLVTTQPYFGGCRWWWVCPRCGSRAMILYLSPKSGQFECRCCCDLVYRSSQEHDKTMDKWLRMSLSGLYAALQGHDPHDQLRAAKVILQDRY